MTETETSSDGAIHLERLLESVVTLRREVLAQGDALLDGWRPRMLRPSFQVAARNLALYLALRRNDLRPLQRRLMAYGLSSLGRSESHVLPALDALVAMLSTACGTPVRSQRQSSALPSTGVTRGSWSPFLCGCRACTRPGST
jgi:pyruvate kinase